jgi:hypothetical protein
MEETIYYVYAYIRSKDSITSSAKKDTPYYIGKGKFNRAYNSHGKLPVPKDRRYIVFLETNLTNIGALALERRMIEWYGRIACNDGILRNITAGGDGTSGYVRGKFSKEHIEKLSQAKTGNKHHGFGVPRTAEVKLKLSQSKIGDKNPNYNKITSIETKKKLSDSLMGHVTTENARKLIGDALRGKKQKVLQCPHCNKTGGTTMYRWHFDKCPHKDNIC